MSLPHSPPLPQRTLRLLPKLPDLMRRQNPRNAPPRIRKPLRSSVERPREVRDADGAPVVAGAEGAGEAGAGGGLGAGARAEGGARVGRVVWVVGVLGVAFVVGYAGDVGEGVFGFGQLVAVGEGFEAGVGDVGGGPEGEVVFLTHRCGWVGGAVVRVLVVCLGRARARAKEEKTYTFGQSIDRWEAFVGSVDNRVGCLLA
jgi:hypothetical protein